VQFFCIRNEAIRQTHRALQILSDERQGSLRPGRVLRVAQLYGYLQWRSRGNRDVRVTLRDLGAAWFVQPRLLKADLDDLQTLGWLRFRSDANGTTVTLMSAAMEGEPSEPDERECASQELLRSLETTAEISSAAEVQACAVVQPRVITKPPSEPSTTPEGRPAVNPLIAQFAAIYNQHKPQTWPTYTPTGTVLGSRLRQAIRHAGGAEAFELVLIRALRSMPEFWRTEYPQERSGAHCAGVLLKVDRGSEGRGVEHWHVFCWGAPDSAAYTGRLSGGIGGNTPAVGQEGAPYAQESDLHKANRLLFWNRDHWHGRGIEAAKLDRCEKQRLAELLEAQGEGRPGAAAEQFSQPPRQH
jgi:hypothetical protein